MIPAKLFTAVLNDACAFILATREWVERKVDSALRGELTWSPFIRLTYWAVQRTQIVTIAAANNARSPGMGNHMLPPERSASAWCMRPGSELPSFRFALSASRFTPPPAFWLPGVRVFFHHVFQCNGSLNSKLLTSFSRKGSASRIIPCTEPGTTPGLLCPRC